MNNPYTNPAFSQDPVKQERLAEAQIPPHLNPINQLIVCQWQP